MRKIAANYILPVSSPPLRNGVVIVDDDGYIMDVIDTVGKLKESSSLEFYQGIVIPGFILPWYRAPGQANTFTESGFRDFDLLLSQQGIKGIGIVERNAGHFARKKESPINYHTIFELCPGSDQQAFENYQKGIDLVSEGWNKYNQACSLSYCTSALMETDLAGYILQYAARHQAVIPMENSEKWPFPEQFARLKQQMDRLYEDPPEAFKHNTHLVLINDQAKLSSPAQKNLEKVFTTFHSTKPKQNLDVLEALRDLQESSADHSFLGALMDFTLCAAEVLFEDDITGSIEPGKKPGLNLLSNIEPGSFRLTKRSTLRVLI